MNVIEVDDEASIWPYRTACALCKTVVELDPYDIHSTFSEASKPGYWECPRCGAACPVAPQIAGASRFEVERLGQAENAREPFDAEGNATAPLYSNSPALPLKTIELGPQ
jgi:hypothetical protein